MIKKFIVKLLQFALNVQSKITPSNDKLAHFYIGFIISYITDLFTDNILIVIIPLCVALAKEWLDNTKNDKGDKLGNVERLDVFFTVLSGVLMYLNKLTITT
tara:strand:- start:336 stop:641 length:306 start_codon:yes stop_codon:yes gene_type:complete